MSTSITNNLSTMQTSPVETVESKQKIKQADLIERWQSVADEVVEASKNVNREQGSVQLLAVSKTKPSQMIATLAKQGQQHFGENYLQEALTKISELKSEYPSLIWHYIGSIQRNKTRDISENFDWVHTIERQIIAKRLNDQRPVHLAKLNVLIQLNIDEEESKSGCLPTQLDELVNEIKNYPNLQLRGLMIIPAKFVEGDDNPFVRAQALFKQVADKHPCLEQWDTLSMGMSGDMHEAIANGSTIVRVGTAIFGTRD